MGGGQVQTIPQDKLEAKIGRKLCLGETFTTTSGTWKVIAIGKDGKDTYTVEKE